MNDQGKQPVHQLASTLRRAVRHHRHESSHESELFLLIIFGPGHPPPSGIHGPVNLVHPSLARIPAKRNLSPALRQIANEYHHLLPRNSDNDETMRVSHVVKTLMHVLQLLGW